MKIGYAKTLTGKLDSVTQETFIDQYAVEKFYVDKISSTSLDAPRLTDMLKSVREGDTVIVNAFSEVAYNVRVFLKIVEQLELKKVTFISIRENLDTSTSIGKFAVSILTELKQIEHENLLERQRIGIEQAKTIRNKNFDKLLRKLENEIPDSSWSADLEAGSDFKEGDARCSVRVFERYSMMGGNRLSLTLTMFQNADSPIRLSAITAGGSQAVFFKVNTLGEESFLDDVKDLLEEILEE